MIQSILDRNFDVYKLTPPHTVLLIYCYIMRSFAQCFKIIYEIMAVKFK